MYNGYINRTVLVIIGRITEVAEACENRVCTGLKVLEFTGLSCKVLEN